MEPASRSTSMWLMMDSSGSTPPGRTRAPVNVPFTQGISCPDSSFSSTGSSAGDFGLL
jgi:hypothetical protein